MKLYPAIDLKNGRCVRLVRGDMNQATIYNDDPAAQAREFVEAGFDNLHIVDLNGAFAGKPVNADAVQEIRDAVNLPIQLGGGVRARNVVESWLEAGIERVVVGTLALRKPDLVIEFCKNYPGRIALGIDARAGMVAVQGWEEQSSVPAIDLAKRFEDAGAAAIIYTDIDRDGVGKGPNFDATRALAEAVSTPIIASGGVTSVDDLKTLREIDGVEGAIIGRALYDGSLSPADAIAAVA